MSLTKTKKMICAVTLLVAGMVVSGFSQTWYTTRYWDGCKAHCGWNGNVGGSQHGVVKSCEKDGVTVEGGEGTRSACDPGGTSYTCFANAPYAKSDDVSYVMGALPGRSECGKCYEVEFNGRGASQTDTPTQDTHLALQGKKLIVMVRNTGGLTSQQVDILIPGGGLGDFNAFSGQLEIAESDLGARSGGLLASACNWGSGNVAADQKCLSDACNRVFSKWPLLLEGCLWHANWMKAANNPEVTYKGEVTCPEELVHMYKTGTRPSGNPQTEYTITFNANGGSVTPTSAQTSGGKISNLPTPTRSGYNFDGWYTAQTGGTQVTTSTSFTSATTIWARWSQQGSGQTYTITFNANGGSVSPSTGTTSTGGTLSSLPTPTRSGYTFNGWYTAQTGGTQVSTSYVFSSNATIWARWSQGNVVNPDPNNLVQNGTFSGTTSWELKNNESSTQMSASGNKLTVTGITQNTSENYRPQVIQTGINLSAGTYTLTFTASAASARTMTAVVQLGADPWTAYGEKDVSLTTTEQTFTVTVTVPSNVSNGQLSFNLGASTANVTISNVKLVAGTSSIRAVGRPIVTRGNVPMVAIRGRVLSVSPVDGANLHVRVVDVKGKVRADFRASGAADFSLSRMPAGRYFVEINGAGVKQTTPVVLK